MQAAIDAHGAPKIVHADHGSSFLAEPFITLLKNYEIKQSNSRVGNSLDNHRPIEYFFGLLKLKHE